MTYESRPSNGVPFLVGALPFGLVSLLVVCSALDVLQRAIENGSGAMFVNFASHLVPLVLFGIAPIALMGFLFVRAQKKLKAWQADGGEQRLAAQQASFQAQHAQAAAAELAQLAARGIHLLAPYSPRPATTDLDRYIDSVLGPQLRAGEIILDRAYGSSPRGSGHFLVGVTSQRVAFLETTFLGFSPAQKCTALQIVELSQVAKVEINAGALATGIALTERDGKETATKFDTTRVDTGFADQAGFARRVSAWLDATVRALHAGASLAGPAQGGQSTSPSAAAPVQVRWPDGSLHQALVVRSEGEQALCRFQNGAEQWVPRTAIV